MRDSDLSGRVLRLRHPGAARFAARGIVVVAAGMLLVSPATAQIINRRIEHPPATQGPSSASLGGLFGLNGWDRTILGARARAMGGACLAMPGGAGNDAANPAATGFLIAGQLASESRYQFGSSTGSGAPAKIAASSSYEADVSDFRSGVTSSYTYNNLSYGMPILFLGRRAGVGLAYRRLIDFDTGEESRFRVRVEQGTADFGVGMDYQGGVDAVTPRLAMCLSDRLSVGGALNFMTGTISATGNQGVTSFGAVIVRGDFGYRQNVYGTSLDLGAQYKATGGLTLAGILQPGHDLKFRDGTDLYHPLADYSDPSAPDLYLERNLLDHALSVPTKLGAGLAYRLGGGRMTLAADYWNQPWSNATITQDSLYADISYGDPGNLSGPATSITLRVLDSPTVRNAGMKDTHHFRLGAEWMLKDSDNGGLRIPLRVGFRRQPFTFSNVDTAAFNEKIYRGIVAAVMTVDSTEVTRLVNDLYQNGAAYMVGSKVPATTLTAGAGLSVGAFSADFAVSRTTYSVDRLFLGAFSDKTQILAGALSQPLYKVHEDRSVTEFTITTTLRF